MSPAVTGRGRAVAGLSIIAKMVMTSDSADAWGLSESGLMHLPLSTLYNYPILQPETTQVFLAVDDCGTIINPLIVEGQVHGGLAQGIGQAMIEEAIYDDDGQLITGSFMDYAVPRAEGEKVSTWLLQDWGDIVAHFMLPEARELYDLEGLWADAKRVDWQSIAGVPRAKG